jgi:hypothetical protein
VYNISVLYAYTNNLKVILQRGCACIPALSTVMFTDFFTAPLNEKNDCISFGIEGMQPTACCNCVFESRRGHEYLSFFECFVLSGRGLCDRPITRPEESY